MRSIRERAAGALATAWSVASIARDLWQGLSVGMLRYDADGDLIDEDPPRPEVTWEHGATGYAKALAGGYTLLVQRYDSPEGPWWTWSVRPVSDGPDSAWGRTSHSGPEARRRAEEALAVMLEASS